MSKPTMRFSSPFALESAIIIEPIDERSALCLRKVFIDVGCRIKSDLRNLIYYTLRYVGHLSNECNTAALFKLVRLSKIAYPASLGTSSGCASKTSVANLLLGSSEQMRPLQRCSNPAKYHTPGQHGEPHWRDANESLPIIVDKRSNHATQRTLLRAAVASIFFSTQPGPYSYRQRTAAGELFEPFVELVESLQRKCPISELFDRRLAGVSA